MWDWLRVLVTPKAWIQNENYSAQLDTRIRDLLKTESFKEIGNYTAQLGNLKLWISNHPYASFTIDGEPNMGRPSRRTILKAHDRLVFDRLMTQVK